MLRQSLSHLMDSISSFSSINPTPISIQHLIKHGAKPSKKAMLLSAQFLHNELPIRFAHRITELEQMPFGLSQMPSILELKDRYIESFQEFLNFPVMALRSSKLSGEINYSLGATETSKMFRKTDLKNISDSLSDALEIGGVKEHQIMTSAFVEALQKVKERHDGDMITLAHGLKELKAHLGNDQKEYFYQLNKHLDPFNIGRIGIRLLIGQHIALEKGSPEGHIGLVAPKCNINAVLKSASDAARFICLKHYPTSLPPNITFDLDPNLTFPYFPSVLYYICFELFKNSLRATIEFNEQKQKKLPDILLVCRASGGDLALKINDQGGGIKKDELTKVWTYMYTTATPKQVGLEYRDPVKKETKVPMAGFGYGLPLSRLYAQYLGGNLELMSIHGFGTDAYLSLNRLGDVVENLRCHEEARQNQPPPQYPVTYNHA